MITRVTTGCRLHFGLLNPSASPLPRRFGGAGMMLDAFKTVVAGQVVEAAPPAHAGLGSGTQLALAKACALHRGAFDPVAAARAMGRGKRSAIGIHGFAHGGFLVDGGKTGDGIAPLVARLPFPEEWRVVLAFADRSQGMSGPTEQSAIDSLPANETLASVLSRLLLLGVLPALAEEDLAAFGAALTEYNARAGELFAPAQGGIRSSSSIVGMVERFRELGAAGMGQSSWGPCVFALAESEKAEWIAARVPGSSVASGRNRGYDITLVETQGERS